MTIKELAVLSSSLLCFLSWTAADAFVPHVVLKRSNEASFLLEVGGGGKGWDSDSYLDHLGGGDEDDEDEKEERLAAAQESYKQFQKQRKAFLERQQSYSQKMDDRTRRFMESRRAQLEADSTVEDEMFQQQQPVEPNKMGGTRFSKMMNQSQQRNNMNQGVGGGFMEQKFAVPLDDDDDDDEIGNEE